MIRGRKPAPRGLRKGCDAGPEPPDALPRCPSHLSPVAQKEWRRLATPLWRMGVLTVCDRAAFAAYCQSYARWVEAEEKLAETPPLLKTPSGYVQQSPWLSVSNKQLELMSRYMAELGLTPSSRTRLRGADRDGASAPIVVINRFPVDDAAPMSAEQWLAAHGDAEEADIVIDAADAEL